MNKDQVKIIHYCWFGPRPLSKTALKCIKSWKKFLPDYKIIKWSEENVDINECPFVKEAYENKKWAFVADYARTKAIHDMGGIYFDTDMEITKDISKLLENETFIGVEDSGMIACGVWREKNKNSYLSTKMLEFYNTQEHFNSDDMFAISIPRVITSILNPLGFDSEKINEIQILEKDICVYPREYFYPLSYDYQNNMFTQNTCMVHLYDATWVSKPEKIKLYFRRHNMKFMIKLFDICLSINRFFKRIGYKIKGTPKEQQKL